MNLAVVTTAILEDERERQVGVRANKCHAARVKANDRKRRGLL
jgi:hypothetical protein